MLVRKSSIAELESCPNIHRMLEEYAAESATAGLPHPKAKVEMYKQLEANGILVVFGAFIDIELIGYITVLSTVLPHYGVLISVAESFFVLKSYRKTGAGLELLRAAENHSQSIGSPGLLISAPSGGVLVKVLQASKDYTETNRVFFKCLT